MQSIRIFFLSIIVSSVSTVTCTSYNHLSVWQKTYLDAMTPDELQFTANFLYLSYALALVESKIRQFNTPILHLNQSVRLKIAEYKDYKDIADDLAMLRTLLERLSYVAGARSIYTATYNTCQQQYAQYATQTIEDALSAIQQDAQTQLRTWADKKTNETHEQLKKSSENIQQAAQYFSSASGLYNGMSKGDLPVDIDEENKKNTSLVFFDLILNSSSQFITVAENLTDTINGSSDYASQIVTVGAEIYKQYYTVIHHFITAPTCDKKYATIMFGMYDVLPEEYKSQLPNPDNVFSHMLETTKLYTQAEFVQQ